MRDSGWQCTHPGEGRFRAVVAHDRVALEIRSWASGHERDGRSVHVEGRELPREVGACLAGPLRVLCLGPGEWLLVAEERVGDDVLRRLAAELAGQGAVLVDMTEGLGVFEVSGSMAREVLSKGCGLDLDPHSFPVGRCARTRLAQMTVIIDHPNDAPGFDLYVARSYLRSLAEWLEDAAIEFNVSHELDATPP